MRSRRGGAMLLVLMTSTIMIVGVSLLARTQSSSAIAAMQASRLQLCHHLITAAEEPTLYWLNEFAGGVVTDPDHATPMVSALDTQMEIDGSRIRIQITAWDQHGMWPSNFDAPGSGVAQRFSGTKPLWELSGLSPADRVYPTQRRPVSRNSIKSTHNPWPTQLGRTRRGAIAAINVNTSPRELLEQASAHVGLGDLQELIEQRKRGEFVTVTQSARDAGGREVRLVSTSYCWSVRTQITVDGVTRGTWGVYANRGGHWQLVKREVIDESNH